MGDIASSIGEENALALLSHWFSTTRGVRAPATATMDLLASDANRLRFEIRADSSATTEMIRDREADCRESHAVKHPARQLTKARRLLKADASEAGEGWSDCQIAAALNISVDTLLGLASNRWTKGLRRFWSASIHQP